MNRRELLDAITTMEWRDRWRKLAAAIESGLIVTRENETVADAGEGESDKLELADCWVCGDVGWLDAQHTVRCSCRDDADEAERQNRSREVQIAEDSARRDLPTFDELSEALCPRGADGEGEKCPLSVGNRCSMLPPCGDGTLRYCMVPKRQHECPIRALARERDELRRRAEIAEAALAPSTVAENDGNPD